MGSAGARVLGGVSAGVEFVAGGLVARAVSCQRVRFDGRAPRCGWCGCVAAGRVRWAWWPGWPGSGCGSAAGTGAAAGSPGGQGRVPAGEVTAAPAG